MLPPVRQLAAPAAVVGPAAALAAEQPLAPHARAARAAELLDEDVVLELRLDHAIPSGEAGLERLGGRRELLRELQEGVADGGVPEGELGVVEVEAFGSEALDMVL